MSPDWTGILLPICFGVVFGVIGAAILAFAISQQRKARRTEQWLTAPGSVTAARIDQERRVQHTQGGTTTRTTYAPVVEYTYTVNGTALQGKRLSPGGNMSYDYATAERILSRYQPGQPVSVHYDPADPTQAVLETKAAGGLLLFIVGGVFLVIGLGIGGASAVTSLLALF